MSKCFKAVKTVNCCTCMPAKKSLHGINLMCTIHDKENVRLDDSCFQGINTSIVQFNNVIIGYCHTFSYMD
jgi:hypothetical protein